MDVPQPGSGSFFQSFKTMFERRRTLQQRCVVCNAPLIYRDFEFRMVGDDGTCTVPIGFCPHCDGIPPVEEPTKA